MSDLNRIYEELLAFVKNLWIVDTHEHTAVYKSVAHPDYLKTSLNTYARMDLRSAGMPPELLSRAMDDTLPVMERCL